MTDFVLTVTRWWTMKTSRHSTANSTQIDQAHHELLLALRDVDHDNPLREAVVAWIAMENRHVNNGAGPAGHAERHRLGCAVNEALAVAHGPSFGGA